jgi:hypothetical protein
MGKLNISHTRKLSLDIFSRKHPESLPGWAAAPLVGTSLESRTTQRKKYRTNLSEAFVRCDPLREILGFPILSSEILMSRKVSIKKVERWPRK